MDRKIHQVQFNLTNGKQVHTAKLDDSELLYFIVSLMTSRVTSGVFALENGTFVMTAHVTDFSILKNGTPFHDDTLLNRASAMVSELLNSDNSKPVKPVETLKIVKN